VQLSDQSAPGSRTYSETVARGFYSKHVGGLFGKYDNVRTYWEDQQVRLVLRTHIKECVRRCGAEHRGVRIVDLGCGAGQGYELLTRIDQKGLNLDDEICYVLPPDKVALYLGLDLSDAMLEQGRENYRGVPAVRFRQADLCEGLGPTAFEAPFDIYFSSYGALSHLDAASLRRCLTDVIQHAVPGALVVLDLVGRYSPEWPSHWSAEDESEKVRSYSMSYLYDDDERRNGDVESFPLRFWTGEEVRGLCREVATATGVAVEVVELFDRSLFVGRHVDTGEYGCCLPPLRRAVNNLYELNVRTPLEPFLVEYRPVDGADELNRFFAVLAMCWNRVVEFTLQRLQGERVDLVSLPGWRQFPPALQMAVMTMDRVIDSVSWIDLGDVRANILEPQLAYVLRRLEHAMQQGWGCGHGLVAVLRVSREQSVSAVNAANAG
jgi:SAM-dependent methyltransferase